MWIVWGYDSWIDFITVLFCWDKSSVSACCSFGSCMCCFTYTCADELDLFMYFPTVPGTVPHFKVISWMTHTEGGFCHSYVCSSEAKSHWISWILTVASHCSQGTYPQHHPTANSRSLPGQLLGHGGPDLRISKVSENSPTLWEYWM